MATAEAPSEKIAKGCFVVAVAVIALFFLARCAIGHHTGQRDDRERDRAHARSVALARTFAADLAAAKGPTPAARAATAAGHHKEIAVRAVDGQAVTIEIGMQYGNSLDGGDLSTCFRVLPPAADPAEVTCPK
ncbi:hypothetical protein [Streptomyces sp. CA-111067]|uniref:hypothetical protein n=1 Tax=Streptomyces sp. CA-111067 TaxID=3240046 RepID=UPI003D965AAC